MYPALPVLCALASLAAAGLPSIHLRKENARGEAAPGPLRVPLTHRRGTAPIAGPGRFGAAADALRVKYGIAPSHAEAKRRRQHSSDIGIINQVSLLRFYVLPCSLLTSFFTLRRIGTSATSGQCRSALRTSLFLPPRTLLRSFGAYHGTDPGVVRRR